VTQQILAAIQAQMGPEQVVSARLLPTEVPDGAVQVESDNKNSKVKQPAA
jgi:hypothetical protein